MLRFLRVSLFVRCITRPHAPTLVALYCARNNKRSWLRAVSSDLRFISVFAEGFRNCLGWTLAQWCAEFKSAGPSMLRKISQALKACDCTANSFPPGH
eukprot:3472882-Karenia_brevis.AAC.1